MAGDAGGGGVSHVKRRHSLFFAAAAFRIDGPRAPAPRLVADEIHRIGRSRQGLRDKVRSVRVEIPPGLVVVIDLDAVSHRARHVRPVHFTDAGIGTECGAVARRNQQRGGEAMGCGW
jgi:hypothetical protein